MLFPFQGRTGGFPKRPFLQAFLGRDYALTGAPDSTTLPRPGPCARLPPLFRPCGEVRSPMRDTKLSVIFLGILAFLAVGFVLKTLAPILLPFVVAVFLSRIFSPLNKALRRRRVPIVISILLVLVLVTIVLSLFSWAVYSNAQSFTEKAPQYQERLKGLAAGVSG